MKIDTIFSATKAMIQKDVDPFGRKTGNQGTQIKKKDLIDKNMFKMIKLES